MSAIREDGGMTAEDGAAVAVEDIALVGASLLPLERSLFLKLTRVSPEEGPTGPGDRGGGQAGGGGLLNRFPRKRVTKLKKVGQQNYCTKK